MRFAHELEERFAEILDFFEIAYLYEPTTFVIKKNGNGEIKKGFTPDFYLPDLDIYIEITAMNGSSCNKKRRKIEAVAELYGTTVILFHRKRIEDILTKFKRNGIDNQKIYAILSP